jgi:hypothetical protein
LRALSGHRFFNPTEAKPPPGRAERICFSVLKFSATPFFLIIQPLRPPFFLLLRYPVPFSRQVPLKLWEINLPLSLRASVFTALLFPILVFPAGNNLLTQPKKATDTMGMIVKKNVGQKIS